NQMVAAYRSSGNSAHHYPSMVSLRTGWQNTVVLEQPLHAIERQGLGEATGAAHGLRSQERIYDRFFGGIGDRLEQWIERIIADRRLARGGKGDHEVAGAVLHHAACAAQPDEGAAAEPDELTVIDRR